MAVTINQYHLIDDWQIMERQTNNQVIDPIAQRVAGKHGRDRAGAQQFF